MREGSRNRANLPDSIPEYRANHRRNGSASGAPSCERHCAGRPGRLTPRGMILIGLGGNLPSSFGSPEQTFQSALRMLERRAVKVLRLSSVYVSPAWPANAGPEFRNQVAWVETRLPPGALLKVLQGIEALHGRVRNNAWGPRTLDLDILDFRGLVTDFDHLALPHPWVEERAFVLKPIAEIAPAWRHPVTGGSAAAALAALNPAEADACQAVSPN